MRKILILLTLLLSAIYACKKDSTISLQINDDIGVDRIDTFTVNSYTLSLDSLPTNAQQVILLGSIKDSFSGLTQSNNFSQISLSYYSDIDTKATFDSIGLVLYYNRYWYGDTLANQTLHVHELTESLALKDIPQYLDLDEQPIFVTSSALYNTNKFSYNPVALASVTFKPQPHKKDSIYIKLPQEMGLAWFNYIKNKDERFTDETKFLEFFKGVALISDASNTNMIGFQSDSLKIKLNYSYYNSSGLKTKANLQFLANTGLQFNQISANRTGTLYQSVKNRKTVLPATSSNNQSLIQSGTGVVTKLTLPGLTNFLEQNSYPINNAELRIPVVQNSNKAIKLPEKLVMMYGTKNNTPFYLVPDFEETATQYAYLTKESGDIDRYYYSFNLTKQINKINAMQKVGESVLISYPTDNLFNSAEQVIINNQINSTSKIKLIITYTKF